jgi:hypothetical protein
MVRLIQSGRAQFVRRFSARVSLFLVDACGLGVPAIYDSKRKTIVTVLPMQALESK